MTVMESSKDWLDVDNWNILNISIRVPWKSDKRWHNKILSGTFPETEDWEVDGLFSTNTKTSNNFFWARNILSETYDII